MIPHTDGAQQTGQKPAVRQAEQPVEPQQSEKRPRISLVAEISCAVVIAAILLWLLIRSRMIGM